jgi:hypothetical protein
MDPIQLEEEGTRRRRELWEVATLLYWGGFALLGTYIASVLALAWPVQLLRPAWQLRIIDTLREGAFLPLLGAMVIVLAGLLQPSDDALVLPVRRVRALAVWASIGFALLIPLQTFAGVNQLRNAGAEANRRVAALGQATKVIENARTETALRQALRQVPGVTLRLPEPLGEPVPKVRSQLSAALRPRIKAAETAIQDELAKRWQSWMLKAIRDALVAGFFAVGFAGIGQSAPQRPTLLMRLSSLFRRRGRGRPARSRQVDALGIPSGWLPEEDQTSPPAKGSRRTP